jgi:hypothetical protein
MPPKSSPQLAKQDNATDSEKSEPKLSTLAMAVLAAGSVRTLYDSDWSQAKKDSEKRKLKQENKAKKASAKRRKLRAKLGKAELDSDSQRATSPYPRPAQEPRCEALIDGIRVYGRQDLVDGVLQLGCPRLKRLLLRSCSPPNMGPEDRFTTTRPTIRR